MVLQPVYGKGPHPLLRTGSRDARVKITANGVLNRLNYCVNFVVYRQFTV
jgi:hypothetical protein